MVYRSTCWAARGVRTRVRGRMARAVQRSSGVTIACMRSLLKGKLGIRRGLGVEGCRVRLLAPGSWLPSVPRDTPYSRTTRPSCRSLQAGPVNDIISRLNAAFATHYTIERELGR